MKLNSNNEKKYPILELSNVNAHYGTVTALRNINLNINYGEIHAIVGEHGAGKSTIAKIVANLITPASGQVLFENQPFTKLGYKGAINVGVKMVFQKMQLNESLTVADNFFLSNKKIFQSHFRLFSKKKVQKLAGDFLKKNNFNLNPLSIVAELELSERALLSIIRNLYTPPSILILDEALEKLSAVGLEQVISHLKNLRSNGSSVLFITHRIDDLYMIADRVSVIRKGEVVISEDIVELDKINLIKMAYTQFTSLEKRTEKVEEFSKLLKFNEAVLKKLPINLIVSNFENKIKLINESAVNFFKLDESINISLHQLLDKNTIALQIIDDALDSKEMKSQYNVPLQINSGNVIVNIIVYPIIDGSVLIGNMLIIEDITEREDMREKLVLSEKLASIGLLAAGVAHEINNPLAVICNYLESIKQNKVDEKEKGQIIEHLFNQVDYITQIIGNLITFSENRNQIVENLNPGNEIIAIIELIKYNGKQKNIDIDFVDNKEELYIRINRNEFKQVILNLFKNAFEAMPDGGKITIKILERDIGGNPKVIVNFADNGPGINFKDPNDVFLPFKSSKGSSVNSGLGLSLCYNIISRHDGDIVLISPYKNGCVFEITLPRVIL